LIVRKINKIIATKCHSLRIIRSKIDFGWGCAPDPAGGAYSTPKPFKGDLLLRKGEGKRRSGGKDG